MNRCYSSATDDDERAAYHILAEAFEAPVRAIYENAGFDPSEVMAKLGFEDGATGFDVVEKKIVNVFEAGIFDSAQVQKTAVHNAISTAALALTVDTLVHLRKLEIARE
jgi:chaperonin GroEL